MTTDFNEIFYVLDGHEVRPAGTFEAWVADQVARLRATEDPHRVGFDVVGDAMISTIFVGLGPLFEFNKAKDGRPLLFETMVFSGSRGGEGRADLAGRYATWDEAAAGHTEIVDRLKNG